MAVKAESQSSGSGRAAVFCGMTSFLISAASLALFVYTAMTLIKYTPLYKPMECMQRKSALELSIGAGFVNATGAMKKDCQNPNSYPIEVSSTGVVGNVFLLGDNATQTDIGSIFVDESTFPAHGEALATARLEISMPAAQAFQLFQKPLVQIVAKTHVHVEATLSYLGAGLHSAEDNIKFCGFELKPMTRQVGPSACAPSLEELVIPDIDSKREPELVRKSAKSLAEASRKKNLAFAVILAVCGLVFLASSFCGVRTWCRSGAKEVRTVEDKHLAVERV